MVQGLAMNGSELAGNLISYQGGVNSNSTTLFFQSIIGGLIDFTVYVFG